MGCRSFRSMAKSLPAFSLICLCLQSLFGPAVARGKNPRFPSVHISSQSTTLVATRLAAQNALFKEQYEDDMRASPESETARGDYRCQLSLYSRMDPSRYLRMVSKCNKGGALAQQTKHFRSPRVVLESVNLDGPWRPGPQPRGPPHFKVKLPVSQGPGAFIRK